MTADFPCPHCLAPTPPTANCAVCGRSLTVCGDTRATGLLGKGGVGVVLAGESPRGPVAIKVVALRDGTDLKAYELFRRSCDVLGGLHHRGLPRVLGFERGPTGSLILVRERFDGGTLAERVERGQRLDGARFEQLFAALLELLDYLHGQLPPVLHRDIKPANIMFRTPGDAQPVLVDFDTVAAPGSQATRDTIVVSRGYTAPEQFAGDATPACDLYSLGATLLFAATHQQPDELPSPLDVPGLPRHTRRLIAALVERDPRRRPASAAEALERLRGAPPPTRTPTATRRQERDATTRTNPKLVMALMLLLSVGIAVGGYFALLR